MGDFKSIPDEIVAKTIVERLIEKKTSELGFEKSIEQLRILSTLRKLQPQIEIIMEKISKYFVEENDYFFNKGKKLGIELGKELEKELEKQNDQKFFVTNLIQNTNFNFSDQDIASLASVLVAFVETVRKELKEKKN